MPGIFRRLDFLKFANQPDRIGRVLVIRNGLIGDIISITPVLERLHAVNSSVKIDVIIGPKATGILDNFPYIQNIYPFHYNYSALSILKQIAFFTRLRKNKYDLVIVQEVNTHFTLMAKLVGGKYTIGFKNSLAWLYDYAVIRPEGRMIPAEAATVAGWTTASSPIAGKLYVTKTETEAALGLLPRDFRSKASGICVIHAGSSYANSDRQWVAERYAAVADFIHEKHNKLVVFTGMQYDSAEIERIQSFMKSKSVNIAGKTIIRQLIALVDLSDIVIGPDTGTMHMAAACKVPVVMLMGISDPEDTGAYSPDSPVVVVTSALPCIPCVHTDPKPERWQTCLKVRPVLCMQALGQETVIKEIDTILSKKN